MKKKRDFDIGFSSRVIQKTLQTKKTFSRILFILVLSSASINLNAQVRVNLDVKDASLIEVFKKITQLTKYEFVYSNNEIPQAKRVTLNMVDKDLKDVLAACLKDTKLWYKIEDQAIVISPKLPKPQTSLNTPEIIKGVVKDRSRVPLYGATVMVKNTTLLALADDQGKFSLNIPDMEDIVLVVSCVGMVSKEIKFTGQKELNVILEDDVLSLAEVVATGIFNKPKESYTGSVTSITNKDLEKVGSRSVLTQIRNLDPSFNVLESNLFGSDPNRLPEIQMRGNTNLEDVQTKARTQSTRNNPVFIMDGFEISLQRVMDMDIDLVESITLLKDASATAMYGARGANGVVVVTTKRPKEGKLHASYGGSINIEVADLSSYDVLNAREKLDYEVSVEMYKSKIPYLQLDLLNLYNKRLMDINRGVDTYWLKYPVRTGVGHRHSVRVEGGDKVFQYALSLNYNNIKGVMKGSGRNTLSGNIALSYKYRNLSFKNDLNITDNNATNSPYSKFEDYVSMNPYWEPFDKDGNPIKILGKIVINRNESNIYNPLYNAQLPSKDESRYTEIQNNFSMEWYILPELFVRGRFSIKKQLNSSDKYTSRNHTSFSGLSGEDYLRRGSYIYSTGDDLTYEGDVTASYSKTFANKHQLYAGLSYNFSEDNSEKYIFETEGFMSSRQDDLGMASAYKKNGKPLSYDNISRRLGGIANVNYTYNRRYYVDLSGKLEGSSQFGSNKRMAPFWSAGLGWNIHNERLFENSPIVNTLRIRGSYGVTGSQSFSPFQSLNTMKFFADRHYEGWGGVRLMALGNPDLAWQQTKQFNIGVETHLLQSRISVNFDYYNKLTDDLVAPINLPLSAGFPTYTANIGKISNQGIEISATIRLIRNTSKELFWTVGGSMIHNKNKILKIANSLDYRNEKLNEEVGPNPSFLYKEGQSMNTIFVVPSLGIDPSNGKEILVKQDGTKTYVWNAKDKAPCGVTDPKIFGNLHTMFRYKGLSCNIFFRYRMGGSVFNQTLMDRVENVKPEYNVDRRAFYARWKNVGDAVFFKDVRLYGNSNATSRFVQKENTLDCSSIKINYDLPSDWLKSNFGLSFFSVGFSTEDVFRISTIKQERGTSYLFARKYSFSALMRF